MRIPLLSALHRWLGERRRAVSAGSTPGKHEPPLRPSHRALRKGVSWAAAGVQRQRGALLGSLQCTPEWRLMIGGRFDRLATKRSDDGTADMDLERTDNTFSPRIGLVYEPVDWVSLYATYSRSFQPMADNGSCGGTAMSWILRKPSTKRLERSSTSVTGSLRPSRCST